MFGNNTKYQASGWCSKIAVGCEMLWVKGSDKY